MRCGEQSQNGAEGLRSKHGHWELRHALPETSYQHVLLCIIHIHVESPKGSTKVLRGVSLGSE